MIKTNEQLNTYLKSEFPDYNILLVQKDDIVFEERVKMNCFYCGKYGKNWKCPPNLPDIDFKTMFSEYNNHALVYRKFSFTFENFDVVRNNSSLELHHTLLKLEHFLWENNNATSISFIGGSCKLCKNGCGIDKCNNPYKARSPIEATGVNVVKTALNCGIKISFPPKEYIIRIGMILW